MTKEEAIKILESLPDSIVAMIHPFDINYDYKQALDMVISALKDIEKIQTIIDNYFTIGKKSGYECMVEIDSILEPYKKGE